MGRELPIVQLLLLNDVSDVLGPAWKTQYEKMIYQLHELEDVNTIVGQGDGDGGQGQGDIDGDLSPSNHEESGGNQALSNRKGDIETILV